MNYRNNKGQFFLPLFVLFTLITLTMLFLALQERSNAVVGEGSGLLGNKQLSLIHVESAADRALLYLDLSASLAFTDAFIFVLAHDGLASPIVLEEHCGAYRGVQVYGDTCFVRDAYVSAFSTAYQESLSRYLQQYYDPLYPSFTFPLENYVFQIKGNTIYGYAQNPLVFEFE